jgi:L-lactate dehydrogenase complex protein LldE
VSEEYQPEQESLMPASADRPQAPRVGLFVTCLVDAVRPRIGFAAIQLLEEAGCTVEVPEAQTCCGQPAWNSGDSGHGAALARQVVQAFEGYDYLVAPSGSCAGMIRRHYPEALADDPAWAARARALGERTYEITSFLVDVMGYRPTGRTLRATGTYHDSCAGLRELDVFAQPRKLLAAVDGLEMRKLESNDECCGFGGTFCVKYPAISNAIVEEKAAAIERTGAELLLAGDLGCLMNMAGKLSRRGSSVRAFHTIEVVAGMGDGPAIGEEG